MIEKSKFLVVVALVVVVNALLIYSVSGDGFPSGKAPEFDGRGLQTGDLVFRDGYGLVSRMFRQTSSGEAEYSHAGVVWCRNGSTYVLHLQQEKPGVSLLVESIRDFWSADCCSKGAVYRLDLPREALARIEQRMMLDRQSGLQFDEDFDLQNDSRMYCTEWIRHLVISATGDSAYFPLTTAGDFSYIAPDNLYRNRHARFIYKFDKPL
ncbi:MAG: hypothetical protein JNL88_03735 [Bacteroidia bacterium]|nr:hypothetical protein [Bacteroidia bacterium]